MKPALIKWFAVLAAAMLATAASAQTESVLYNLPKNADPNGRLLRDNSVSGLFYGTTYSGKPRGTVFELREKHGAWKGSTILRFTGANGAQPEGGMIEDSAGNLYGTTATGGSAGGSGTVFQLAPTGQTVLYNFAGGSDGAYPFSDLVMDQATGTLYGTTVSGGDSSDCGTVFQLAQSDGVWTKTTLYAFKGGSDGCSVFSGLRMDKNGNLFGITYYGGGASDSGTVFELSELNQVWTKTVLYTFTGGADGALPADLDLDMKTGTLYGVAFGGGASGEGTIFELGRHHGIWRQTTLYSFGGAPDGQHPQGLKFDGSADVLYGTTLYGGSSNLGTVFSLTRERAIWRESVLHSFLGGPGDGASPLARPIEDPNTGYLYGTTSKGGLNRGGIVYQIVP